MLVIGLSGYHVEVCKNIVLAGVGSVTIVDSKLVTPSDLSANFFLQSSDVGKNVRASRGTPWLTKLEGPGLSARTTRSEPSC